MQKQDLPCNGCLKLPVCRHKKRVQCSDLFFMILDNCDFNEVDRITTKYIKEQIKELLLQVDNIVPGNDWKERLTNDDSLQKMYSVSNLQDEETH